MQAEREARIAAELAELGDTDRVLEERALKQLLAPLGLAIYDIPPDGHCLYRSVEHQLSQLAEQQAEQEPQQAAAAAAESNGGGEGAPSFLGLRALAAEYMRANADHFMPFVLEVGGPRASSVRRACCLLLRVLLLSEEMPSALKRWTPPVGLCIVRTGLRGHRPEVWCLHAIV